MKYTLRKSRDVLFLAHRRYQKKKKELTHVQQLEIEKLMLALQTAVMENNRKLANQLARELEHFIKRDLKKSPLIKFRDFVFALGFALLVAVVVRSMWFELYEIPSGSMRPTFKEKDRLIVSKTDFGLNVPLMVDHFYFDPNLVHRNGVVVFTVENMDVSDGDTIYFYLFPGKKQYIKRLIGKPGDTLYFYGGKIYGIDKEGQDISKELQLPELSNIEHIPFIHMEGKVDAKSSSYSGVYSPVTLYQFNEPVAKLSLDAAFKPSGTMLVPHVADYGDLWGFKNFAMARLLTKENSQIALELKHNPTLSHLTFGQDPYGKLRPMLGYTTTTIPLTQEHLQKIFNNLYTARFVVKNGLAMRYGMDEQKAPASLLPKMPGVPDGTYEFYNGKAYEVVFGGILKELEKTHPLYSQSIALLYNIGIEFNNHYSPDFKGVVISPNRYAYFREGDLYLMGAPIIAKDDPALANSAFKDNGPPSLEEIKRFGITIPEKHYITLGDNHAMSADSRDFGFVPENNLRGAPDFIFWPPGSRFGRPTQPPYQLFNYPRVIIWVAAGIALVAYLAYRRKKYKLPIL